MIYLGYNWRNFALRSCSNLVELIQMASPPAELVKRQMSDLQQSVGLLTEQGETLMETNKEKPAAWQYRFKLWSTNDWSEWSTMLGSWDGVRNSDHEYRPLYPREIDAEMTELEVIAERLLQLSNDEGTAQIHDIAIEVSRLAAFYRRKTEALSSVNDELRQRIGMGEAENERLERLVTKLQAALQQIADWCPATQEMTLAHEMAQEADAALSRS
jgi:hypothetical protein